MLSIKSNNGYFAGANAGMVCRYNKVSLWLGLWLLSLAAFASTPHSAVHAYYASSSHDPLIQQVLQVSNNPQFGIDELTTAIAQADDAQQQAELLYLLTIGHIQLANIDDAQIALQRAQKLVNQQRSPLLYHRLLLAQTQLLEKQGRPEAGLPLAARVAEWARLHRAEQLYSDALITSGLLEMRLFYYDKSLTWLIQAYEHASRTASQINPALIAEHIATAYQAMDNYESSVMYLQESLEYARQHENRLNQVALLFSLGKAYHEMHLDDQALAALGESAELAASLEDQAAVAKAELLIGQIYLKQGNTDSALLYFTKAREVFGEQGTSYQRFAVNYYIASSWILQNNVANAAQYLQSARTHLTPTLMEKEHIQADLLSAQIAAHDGLHQQAYTLLQHSMASQAALVQKESEQQLEQLKMQFDTSWQDTEIQHHQRIEALQETTFAVRGQRHLLIIVVVALSVLLCLLLYLLGAKAKRYQRKLNALSTLDGATGLLTRVKILEALDIQLHLATQREMKLSVAMLNIDNFTDFAERAGHKTADKLLGLFGKESLETFQETDILGRLANETFLFVFPNAGANEMLTSLNKLRCKVKQLPSAVYMDTLQITLSAGVVQVTAGDTTAQVLEKAGNALHQAKSGGRDRVVTLFVAC
ncbi:tetratricopeptide repeat-containing diguanylate cyclase [Salinimonas sediminis]|uniref:diguanylate cyclase n=1 Tax=Salinimonas sediminis TaxID=2303538 RepID=A0A346NMX1_9ALTE|nr:tetratricopeptide repeat-containing diguanylate cyclase [Salinimonas sediminis]AXR06878.1 diguanylate cyclase [Salinimonas sediminis]